MIEIKIEGNFAWHKLDDLIPMQGQLKELSKENYTKLKNEIKKRGFTSPFFIWMNEQGFPEIQDGHQRQITLKAMREEGIEIPDKFPCVVIEAKNRREAARILLGLTSQYGKMTDQGLYEFMHDNEISIEEIKENNSLSDINLQRFEIEFFDEKDNEVKQDTNELNNEINIGDLTGSLNKQCPKCGFEFEG